MIARAALILSLFLSSVPAASAGPAVFFSHEVKHDLSPPLRTMYAAPTEGSVLEGDRDTYTVASEVDPIDTSSEAMSAASTLLLTPLATTAGISFDVGNGSTPSDPNGAIGAYQYMHFRNSAIQVFNKATGASVYGPVAANVIWQGFGGGCQQYNDGDGVILYDKMAHRWIFLLPVLHQPYLACFAVSQTDDATGSWYRYSFPVAGFPDYPKFGIWPDALYAGFNSRSSGSVILCAYDRVSMLQGTTARPAQCVSSPSFNTWGFFPVPVDFDGAALPPTGSPGYFFSFGQTQPYPAQLWRFYINWNTPASTHFDGPFNAPFGNFTNAGCGVPQLGSSVQLGTLAGS